VDWLYTIHVHIAVHHIKFTIREICTATYNMVVFISSSTVW